MRNLIKKLIFFEKGLYYLYIEHIKREIEHGIYQYFMIFMPENGVL